jgi:hypothetical protein
LIPKFATEVPQGFANFGIGTLDEVILDQAMWSCHFAIDASRGGLAAQ